MPKTAKRLRNFCFTLNNYDAKDEARIRQSCKDGHFKFLVYGREKGASGTPHLQGYAELAKQRTIKSAQRLIRNGVHVEPRRGTAVQARDYCIKDDKEPFVHGVLSQPGKRTDLDDLKDDVARGASMFDLMESHDGAWRYLNATRHYRVLHSQRTATWRDLTVTVYWGDAGTGKTRRIFEENPGVYFVPSPSTGTWWFDGYDGQDAVLLDDFYGEMPFSFILRFLDGYPLQLPVKGGFTMAKFTKVFITSNCAPTAWYPDPHGSLERRITNVEHFAAVDSEVGLVLPQPLSIE